MKYFLLAILLCASCAKRNLIERISEIGPDWLPVEQKDIEQAWIIPKEGSSLMLDSTCKKRNKDIPLNALTAQLTIGMTNQTLISQEKLEFLGKEALLSTFHLKIDDNFFMLHTLVLKKEGCVFDLILTAPESAYKMRLPAFNKVKERFTLEPIKK